MTTIIRKNRYKFFCSDIIHIKLKWFYFLKVCYLLCHLFKFVRLCFSFCDCILQGFLLSLKDSLLHFVSFNRCRMLSVIIAFIFIDRFGHTIKHSRFSFRRRKDNFCVSVHRLNPVTLSFNFKLALYAGGSN